LAGLNVTIPYKEQVIPYLDELDSDAAAIGAVNVIKIIRPAKGKIKLVGYNSDIMGFTQSIEPLLEPQHKKALILGTGGASKAIYHGRQIRITHSSRRNVHIRRFNPSSDGRIQSNHQLYTGGYVSSCQ
jgi:shikimate 5-dehydrogenase